MDDLLGRLESLERHVQTLEQQNSSALRRLRWWRRFALVLMVLGVFSLPLPLGEAQPGRALEKGKETLPKFKAPERKPKPGDEDGKGLAQRVRALERKLEHVLSEVSPEGFPELVISGANLRIVNGLGGTETTNGLGNVIVGYNEPRSPSDAPDTRTGSHVIVVGRENNYSQFGGIVVGRLNEISGAFATVIGAASLASGAGSSVTGGISNSATGSNSTVTGGTTNNASGDFASVSGGAFNTASAFESSVSGGVGNTASGSQSSISGGNGNTASDSGSSVSGGLENVASGFASVVSGGFTNIASGPASVVSGGRGRTAPGDSDWVAGGLFQDQ
jgi:hypothetical protein